MQCAVGMSTSPDPRAAAEDAARIAAERLEAPATLAVLVVSHHHARRAERVVDAVHQAASPESLVGCATEAVVAGRREVDEEPAVAVWLAELPRSAETYHMEYVRTSAGDVLGGYQFDPRGSDTHLLVPDPYSFPASVLLAHLNQHAPGTPVLGGFASGRARTTLFRDTKVLTSGAVGVRLPGVAVRPVVSQGCRPVGDPYTVTGAQDGVITELAGQPPLRLLESLVSGLSPHEQQLISTGVHLGIALDEYKTELGRGDFLVRSVVAADEEAGSVQIGEPVEVGTTVQFHVRDAATADEDLRASLTAALEDGRPAGALLFTCNGRGRNMFGEPDHDASLAGELLGDVPLAGFFAAGELGPVGGRNFVHAFTASLALFDEQPDG